MFTREAPGTTLSGIEEILTERAEGDVLRVTPTDLNFHFAATDPMISIKTDTGRKKTHDLPISDNSVATIGDYLGVPGAFMKRLLKNASGTTVDAMLHDLLVNTQNSDLAVTLNKGGTSIVDVAEFGKHRKIKPLDVIRAVTPVFEGIDPEVARLVDENSQFAVDFYAPFTGDKGIGGDRQIDDLSAAGFRLDVNLKQGLVPSVQPFSYRLWCTNGCSTRNDAFKIEGRGQTVDEVLAELEGMARLAFAQAEKDIEHFYDLRNQKVDNVERAIMALARERNIPARSTTAILELVPGSDMPDEPTMFDVVNLVTNFANSPAVRNDGGRLLLENAGGSVISDHAARCGHCHSRLN